MDEHHQRAFFFLFGQSRVGALIYAQDGMYRTVNLQVPVLDKPICLVGFVFSYSSRRYWQTAICKHGGC